MLKNKNLLALGLIIFGILTRLLLWDLPNIETVTVSVLLAGSFLGGFYAIAVGLAIMAVTDMFKGNDAILVFTWSAFAIIGLFGVILRNKSKSSFKYVYQMTGLGIAASAFFYLYTNFGVWLLWPQMYSHDLSGLIQCYVMGLPFLKYNLLGNLLIIPAVSSIVVCAPIWLKRKMLAKTVPQ